MGFSSDSLWEWGGGIRAADAALPEVDMMERVLVSGSV